MPFSEKKGRFTVSITEQPRPPSPTPSLSEAPSAGSPGSSGVNRAVKRGRFLVSCLPCSSSPCLASTLSLQAEEVGLLNQDSLKVVNFPCASRSTCSSDETHMTTIDHSAAALEVTSACQDTCPATAAAMAAEGQGGAPAQSPELRRVRFSETSEDMPAGTPAQQQQQEASTAQAANKRHQLKQPEPPRQLKHTRSYCSGRFMIQEAVSVATAGLYRSTSAPEVAGSMSSSMSSCSSLQATYGPFAAPLCDFSRSGSPDGSVDGSCMRPCNTAGSCADLATANELMSSFMQQHQHSSQQLQHAVLAFPSHGLPCPAGQHAAAAGGLFAFASVPLPSTLGSASSEEEGSLVSSLLSSSDIASDAGHPLLQGTPLPGSSAASSRHSSGSAARRSASTSGSSANLLGSCYSGGAELISAAAAAALGHHYQGPLGHAHSHLGHQHIAPKRSASMTYFRRGRFLVQTTMN